MRRRRGDSARPVPGPEGSPASGGDRSDPEVEKRADAGAEGGRAGERGGGGLRQAVSFLTPVGGGAGATPGALWWFPIVGALIGLGVGTVWWVSGRVWPAVVAAGLAVVADLALTGMLHVDGLGDSADGLLAPMSRERRLAVMAEPEVGAFGVTVVVTVMLLRWACLATLSPSPLLLVALWAGSRTAMAVIAVTVPYARPGGGLASAFRGDRRPPPAGLALLGAVVALAVAAAWRPLVGPAVVAAGAGGAAVVVGLAWRRLGGFTGDVLGAAGMVGETVGLLAACAQW